MFYAHNAQCEALIRIRKPVYSHYLFPVSIYYRKCLSCRKEPCPLLSRRLCEHGDCHFHCSVPPGAEAVPPEPGMRHSQGFSSACPAVMFSLFQPYNIPCAGPAAPQLHSPLLLAGGFRYL